MKIRSVVLGLMPAGALAILLAGEVQGAPTAQPLPRVSSCPSGYYSSGNYCVPGTNARFAIARHGSSSCPSGYYQSGHYCVASSDSAKLAIHRSGSCPSGYYASGDYCVASQ